MSVHAELLSAACWGCQPGANPNPGMMWQQLLATQLLHLPLPWGFGVGAGSP